MLQLFLLAALLLVISYGVTAFLKTAPSLTRKLRQSIIWFGIIMLILLAATGRLGWLIPVIGAVSVGLLRLLPHLLQFAPSLRKQFRSDDGERTASFGSTNGKMSRDEAYRVLGLAPGATREKIIEAHRRLIQKVHPDRGGSDYLAAKLNQAKDILLNR